MTEPETGPRDLGPGTDISAADLDVHANEDLSETSDPEAYDEDGTIAGLGGAEGTPGGTG